MTRTGTKSISFGMMIENPTKRKREDDRPIEGKQNTNEIKGNWIVECLVPQIELTKNM